MVTQEEIVNHLKNSGFVFSNSEIYNGLANAWDYGPLGVLLKQNIKNLWWNEFVQSEPDMVGLDSGILMNQMVWKASGHLDHFSDPLIDCKKCRARFRSDHLVEQYAQIAENVSNEEVQNILQEYDIRCPKCGEFAWTPVRQFNLMFKTYQGVVEDAKSELYLRPETAQGIFINFKNIQRTMRLKLPFGVGQIGKSFRNEITPGNFIFRTREFEQMEIEYFLREEMADDKFEVFLTKIQDFLTDKCGIKPENLKMHEHAKEELSHYSKRTVDFQFQFPHGFSELWGLANRTNYDLTTHQKWSKKDLTYLDPETNERFIPWVIEPSVGVERLFYAICCNAYEVEKIGENDERIVMHMPAQLAPFKCAVLPLVNKVSETAREIHQKLLKMGFSITYDSSGSIGKRYRRQDAIGTPFCITVDYQTDEDQTVTIRDRDFMTQIRIPVTELPKFLFEKLNVQLLF